MTLDGVSVQEMNKRLEEIAEKLNITDILNKRTFEISGDKLKEQQSLVRSFISRNYYLQMNQQGTWTLNLQMM